MQNHFTHITHLSNVYFDHIKDTQEDEKKINGISFWKKKNVNSHLVVVFSILFDTFSHFVHFRNDENPCEWFELRANDTNTTVCIDAN